MFGVGQRGGAAAVIRDHLEQVRDDDEESRGDPTTKLLSGQVQPLNTSNSLIQQVGNEQNWNCVAQVQEHQQGNDAIRSHFLLFLADVQRHWPTAVPARLDVPRRSIGKRRYRRQFVNLPPICPPPVDHALPRLGCSLPTRECDDRKRVPTGAVHDHITDFIAHALNKAGGRPASQKIENNVSLVVVRMLVFIKACERSEL